MNQKGTFLALIHTKKVEVGSFIKAKIWIRIRPDPDLQHCFTLSNNYAFLVR
jgi:hypothetical protein